MSRNDEKPQVVIVKRAGAKWEGLGTLVIVSAMIAPWLELCSGPAAFFIGLAGFVVFLVGRFL